MTSADKKQEAQQIAVEGRQLVDQAEALLRQVVVRNARLNQEIKLTRTELEEKLSSQTK